MVAGLAVAVLGQNQATVVADLLLGLLVLGEVGRAVQESDEIRVLLDGAGLAKVGHAGYSLVFSGALFGVAVELGEHDDRQVQLLGHGLDAGGNLADFALAGVLGKALRLLPLLLLLRLFSCYFVYWFVQI